jgi:hypothetical protein
MYNKTPMDNMWDVISGVIVQMLCSSWVFMSSVWNVYPKVSPSHNYNRAFEVEFMWCVNCGTHVDCTYGVWMAPMLKYLVAYKIMSYEV